MVEVSLEISADQGRDARSKPIVNIHKDRINAKVLLGEYVFINRNFSIHCRIFCKVKHEKSK